LVAVATKLKTYAVPMSGYDEEKRYTVVAETRRKWTAAERKQIVAETEASSVSSVARKHGVAASLVFRWRREAGIEGKKSARKPAAAFLPLTLPALPHAGAASTVGADRGAIEIELANGHKLRVSGPVEATTLKQVLAVLEGR
jgi:transposase